MLSNDDVQRYHEDGFLLVESFIDDIQCDDLRERIQVLIQNQYNNDPISIFDTDREKHTSDDYFLNSGDKIRFFFEKQAFSRNGDDLSIDKMLNKVGHALHDLDPVFDRFSRQPKIASLINSLGLQNPLLIQSMYIFKQPNIGGEVNPHQDGTFLISEPDTLLGLWFALEDSTIDNGCLWAIKGGHREPLKSLFVRREQGGIEFLHFDQDPWKTEHMQPLEAKKGSVIVLHSRLPHMSHENRSPKSRHAFTLHFIDACSQFSAQNWLYRNPEMPFRGF